MLTAYGETHLQSRDGPIVRCNATVLLTQLDREIPGYLISGADTSTLQVMKSANPPRLALR